MTLVKTYYCRRGEAVIPDDLFTAITEVSPITTDNDVVRWCKLKIFNFKLKLNGSKKIQSHLGHKHLVFHLSLLNLRIRL